jgi:hypothetical protein
MSRPENPTIGQVIEVPTGSGRYLVCVGVAPNIWDPRKPTHFGLEFETQPPNAIPHDTWRNPGTGQLHMFLAGAWQPTSANAGSEYYEAPPGEADVPLPNSKPGWRWRRRENGVLYTLTQNNGWVP